jgi:putative Holliday junction resolvase
MRSLAIDFGERHIGIALSDEQGIIAYPYTVLERSSDRSVLEEIKKICQQKDVKRIILGYPETSRKGATPIQQRILSFLKKLKRLGIETILYDERWTTKIARQTTEKMVDARAAAIMLGDYLERQRCSR